MASGPATNQVESTTTDASDLVKTISINVSITGCKWFNARLCIGGLLIRLGLWTIGVDGKVNIDEKAEINESIATDATIKSACPMICADPDLIRVTGAHGEDIQKETRIAQQQEWKRVAECPHKDRYICKFGKSHDG